MGLDMHMYAAPAGQEVDRDRIWDSNTKEWYWRKANAIHNWFVENVQGGEDDCGTYEVSLKSIHRLREDVISVLENPSFAAEVLPTSSGFFYGSTQYDEWYFDDLRTTLVHLREMLDEPEGTQFFYASSW